MKGLYAWQYIEYAQSLGIQRREQPVSVLGSGVVLYKGVKWEMGFEG